MPQYSTHNVCAILTLGRLSPYLRIFGSTSFKKLFLCLESRALCIEVLKTHPSFHYTFIYIKSLDLHSVFKANLQVERCRNPG